MTRQPPAATSGRPSDRLEELARELELLATEVNRAVQRLKEETDHDPAD
ncbi:MAG: hypothetical protein JWM40_2924 [Frankiales bacterium]|nr:hypothetical protein [Frankiales bacterium]